MQIWDNNFILRINELRSVQEEKGTVNGVFLSDEMIFRAFHLMGAIMSEAIETPLIALNDDGALHFEWENDVHFFTITLAPNSELEFFYESDKAEKPVEEKTTDIKTLRKFLSNFYRKSCKY